MPVGVQGTPVSGQTDVFLETVSELQLVHHERVCLRMNPHAWQVSIYCLFNIWWFV